MVKGGIAMFGMKAFAFLAFISKSARHLGRATEVLIGKRINSFTIGALPEFCNIEWFLRLIEFKENISVSTFHVLALIAKKTKVLYLIVKLISVYVMNNLLGFEIAAKMLFHDQAMLLYCIVFRLKRMIGRINFNVSLTFPFPTLPVAVSYRTLDLFSFIPGNVALLPTTRGIPGTFFSFIPRNLTFLGIFSEVLGGVRSFFPFVWTCLPDPVLFRAFHATTRYLTESTR